MKICLISLLLLTTPAAHAVGPACEVFLWPAFVHAARTRSFAPLQTGSLRRPLAQFVETSESGDRVIYHSEIGPTTWTHEEFSAWSNAVETVGSSVAAARFTFNALLAGFDQPGFDAASVRRLRQALADFRYARAVSEGHLTEKAEREPSDLIVGETGPRFFLQAMEDYFEAKKSGTRAALARRANQPSLDLEFTGDDHGESSLEHDRDLIHLTRALLRDTLLAHRGLPLAENERFLIALYPDLAEVWPALARWGVDTSRQGVDVMDILMPQFKFGDGWLLMLKAEREDTDDSWQTERLTARILAVRDTLFDSAVFTPLDQREVDTLGERFRAEYKRFAQIFAAPTPDLVLTHEDGWVTLHAEPALPALIWLRFFSYLNLR